MCLSYMEIFCCNIFLTLFLGSGESSTSGNTGKTQEDAMEETVKKCKCGAIWEKYGQDRGD